MTSSATAGFLLRSGENYYHNTALTAMWSKNRVREREFCSYAMEKRILRDRKWDKATIEWHHQQHWWDEWIQTVQEIWWQRKWPEHFGIHHLRQPFHVGWTLSWYGAKIINGKCKVDVRKTKQRALFLSVQKINGICVENKLDEKNDNCDEKCKQLTTV